MGFMDIRHLYNPSSSFPSRLNVFYSITNIFQDSGPWSDRMNALEDLSKKTGKNHLVKPIAQFGAVLLAGVVALIAFALVCTVWWSGCWGNVLMIGSFNTPSKSS